jgi:uncharacterized protein
MRWTLVVSVPPRPRQFYRVGFPRRIDVVTESQVCNCVPIAPTLEHGIRFLTRLAIGLAKIDDRPAFLKMLDQDCERRLHGGEPATIKAVSDVTTDLCIMPGDAAYKYFVEQGRIASRWRNEVTLRSVDLWWGIDNASYPPWISPTALLMIVALGDELVPPELSLDAFSRAREPKKLLTIPGDHFSPYSEHFPHVSAEATEWFLRHLAVGGARALG